MFKINKITQDFIKTSFGNILEWYDFAIYGLFAIQISKAFFPVSNKFISLLMVFATFAVGFLARPLGSIIFGLIGDRHGKHYSVNLSIWLMAIPTALIGLLPTYQSIGMFAPIGLIILRFCQGISAGGQFSGLIAIAVDSDSNNKPFLTSLIYAISVVGCFAASLVGYLSVTLINYFNPQHDPFISTLTWRIPFILSIVLFIIYHKMLPDLSHHSVEVEHEFSIKDIFKKQPNEIIVMIIISALSGTLYYTLFTYLVTYLQLHMGIHKATAFLIENGFLALSIVLYPLFGYYAHQFKCRARTAQIVSIIMTIGVFGLFYIKSSLILGIISSIILVTTFCAITALITSLFAEVFDENYRMTACSFSFNAGITVSGFSPMIAEILSKYCSCGLQLLLLLVAIVFYIVFGRLIRTEGYINSQL